MLLVRWRMNVVVGLSNLDLRKVGDRYLQLEAEQTLCAML